MKMLRWGMHEQDRNRAFALEVVQRLRAQGHHALWAGGCVRDQLLGKTPKDYDVATSAEPTRVREIFGPRRTRAVGASFGVITVMGPRGVKPIEVATFRRDAQYSDGRHPDAVIFSTAEEDAQRRDFTINGLFYDPVAEQVIDYVGGRLDLELGLVRAIRDPAERFDEDKLRMLRAVRFATSLDFQIDPRTLTAIQQLCGEIVIVSAERIAGEMERLLTDPHRRRGVELLRDSGLLALVLPELQALADAADASGASGWQTALHVLDRLHNPSLAMSMAALLRDSVARNSIDGADAARICERWRLSNEVTKQVGWLLDGEPLVRRASSLPWPRLQRLLVAPWISELLEYGEAVAAVVDGTTREIDHCRARLDWPVERLNPAPLLGGDDLIAAGFQPGPGFRTILDEVRDAQLEGLLHSPLDALALARQIVERTDSDTPTGSEN